MYILPVELLKGFSPPMITFLKSSKPLISHHNLASCKLATSLEKQLKNSFDSCLRFYGPWIFIECSLNSNFFVCLIKSFSPSYRKCSSDQIFFTTFQEELSNIKIWDSFKLISYFSIFPSPTFFPYRKVVSSCRVANTFMITSPATQCTFLV